MPLLSKLCVSLLVPESEDRRGEARHSHIQRHDSTSELNPVCANNSKKTDS